MTAPTAINGTPAMATNPKAIVFSDWDGTITQQDSNDWLTDNLGFGVEKRKFYNAEILHERMSFSEAFKIMLDSVKTPFPECIEQLLQNITLDPGFAVFYKWCKERNIPVVVVSSGMKPVIHALLKKLVGEEAAQDIEIIANDVKIEPDGEWNIVYRDESHFGHDKSRCIKPYAQLPADKRPTMFYCGDGVSDLSAASETDLLFAKAGKDLIVYLEKMSLPYNIFHSFADINKRVDQIYSGKLTLKEAESTHTIE
ncbi:Pdp3-interacting factor 1 [Yarrowia sp. B02]|nr:Pdp3-interacting factor 1 [Yarrowia sp. B02]